MVQFCGKVTETVPFPLCLFKNNHHWEKSRNIEPEKDNITTMPHSSTMKDNLLYNEIFAHQDSTQVEGLLRFFKTGKGQYGEGDQFLGIKVPVIREVVKQRWTDTSFDDLETCITSEYHEMRMAALLTLVQIFKHVKKNKATIPSHCGQRPAISYATQQQCVDFYLAHTPYINNWDLVDLSCYELLGIWLLDKDRTLLYNLARDGKTIWEQRIGMVSTMQFIRHNQLDDTYAIADLFLEKPQPLHDLLQKAVGWLLREAGKRDEQRLKDWLSTRYTTMPRTMLRYAIEKFSDEERKKFM
jgi:3-methyladenine DNA glycosylase AlkD